MRYSDCELRDKLKEDDEDILEWLCGFGIDQGSARSILSYFREQQGAANFIPSDEELGIEGYMDMGGNYNLVFHFPFGRRVNDALSRAYALVLTQMMGCNVSVSITDDTFMLSAPKRIEIEGIEHLVTSSSLEGTLRRAIKDSELFKQRFRHTAARSFMILRNYKGREISAGRQQVRSTYLLETLSAMDGVPVIDETYREIIEDVMDLKNARAVLEMIESGKYSVRKIEYSSTPSPFAHNAILAGISDMVLMEDRGALLRELHRKVLSKVLGAEVSEFEFTEDKVLPYFRQRIRFISSKDELLSLISRAGPLRLLKEKGRSIYPYWSRRGNRSYKWSVELIRERAVASVYIDDAYFVSSEDLPLYSSVLSKERALKEEEKKILVLPERAQDHILGCRRNWHHLRKSMQGLRKLEATSLVGRVDYRDGKWCYRSRTIEPRSREEAMDEVTLRYLECFAPATSEEVSYALGLSSTEVQRTLSDLVQEDLVKEGRFLVSEHPQYMIKKDYLRLKTNRFLMHMTIVLSKHIVRLS